MKIMRSHFQRAIRKSGQARRFDMDYIVLILERAFDQQKPAARDHQPIRS